MQTDDANKNSLRCLVQNYKSSNNNNKKIKKDKFFLKLSKSELLYFPLGQFNISSQSMQ